MNEQELVQFLNYSVGETSASLLIVGTENYLHECAALLFEQQFDLLENPHQFMEHVGTPGKRFVVVTHENMLTWYSLIKQYASGSIYYLDNGVDMHADSIFDESSLVVIISKVVLERFEQEHEVSFRSICGLTEQIN